MLKIYNSLGHALEEFRPKTAGVVKIYVCGPTVWSYLHVGNFRGPVVFNFIRNWLEYLGYKVEYAMNFTDVDDKIINRANTENIMAHEVSEKYIGEYKNDFAKLGLRPHDENPRVTTHMPAIIEFVKTLIEKEYAYVSGNDVHFAISKFSEYGKLSGRKVDDLLEGVRIDVSEQKRSPLDFALWKGAKTSENLRGSAWNSPWGEGRPGWHIECSAMVRALYGDQVDIHGGGIDLLFPHHENEVAQSESCTGVRYANYWVHWNMINFSGSKMSKSLGNVVNMRDFLEKNHPETYKWMILSVHYRSIGEFSDVTMGQSVAGLARVYSALALADTLTLPETRPAEKDVAELNGAWTSIEEALNNDFGTPAAFAVMFDQIRKFNAQVRRGMKITEAVSGKCLAFTMFIKKFGSVLSLFQEPPTEFLVRLDNFLLEKMNIRREDVAALVQERAKARLEKNFEKSDELRAMLSGMNISVSDLPEGSYWEVTK